MKQYRLIAVVLLGSTLLSYPLLWLFNTPALLGGVPALYMYLFATWAALIGLIATVVATADE